MQLPHCWQQFPFLIVDPAIGIGNSLFAVSGVCGAFVGFSGSRLHFATLNRHHNVAMIRAITCQWCNPRFDCSLLAWRLCGSGLVCVAHNTWRRHLITHATIKSRIRRTPSHCFIRFSTCQTFGSLVIQLTSSFAFWRNRKKFFYVSVSIATCLGKKFC
jgi:hypothetical protein